MKVLFITGSLNQGGAEYQILQLAKLFQEKGNVVEVFAITNYSFYQSFVFKNNLKYSHLDNNQNKFKRVIQTSKKIKQFQPDLIISYLKIVSKVAVIAKILSNKNTPLIVGERTSDIQPLHDKVHFNLMRLANAVTVNSLSKLDYIKTNFSGISDKTYFFPNILDVNEISFLDKKYDQSNLHVGFIGRISPEKNILEMIKANEVFEVYKKIDLLILISDYEGFSNVISEALASGLPIITSAIPENEYLVADAVNGFVVDHKEVLSIASGIEKFMNLPITGKRKMSINNRKKSEEIFDKNSLYNKYINLIQKL